ncbi:uncharacterized protein N7515_000127 [Penicillium bovifimosum]|uniref:DNA repair protein Rad26 n=1 Tax=Penicillium bovifimosum TaxID=126998 RepID=A0A9W9HEU9_9EURO|nr:uncharacterized protein N7515_000127 [Penicillium bovifimosum]KAJ5145563.1 hypothetical protein N7515_000127 [Penicillium bovifimosum]
MDDDDDDYGSDDFGSDDFGSLPPGTLYELEQKAFQATQAPASQYRAEPIDNNLAIRAQAEQTNGNESLRPPPRLHTGLTSDYNTLEVGEVDAEVYENVDGQHVIPLGHQIHPMDESWPAHGQQDDAMEVDEYYGHGDAAAEINARLLQMEQERNQMMQELAEARIQLETKAGEISIIRKKQAAITEEHDRQLATLRKTMADEIAKHKQEVEAARSEGKVLATENVFLQQDLVDEAFQARRYKSKHREKEAPITPKKSRVLPFRDGFDDDEIVMISPSKSASRSKRATPTVPGKRKRQSSQDSVVPLDLNPSGVEPIITDAPVDVEEVKSKPESSRNQRFIMRLLGRRAHPEQETDLEALAKLTFPSEPTRSMSSTIMDAMARADPDNYILEYTRTISSLWQRAINEKFYEPIPRLQAIVQYSLMSDDLQLSDLITPLVGVLQDTVEVNAVPRFKYAPASRDKRMTRQTPQADLQPLIDSTGAMRLLYQIACGVLHIESAMEEFWQNVRISFILVMLHPSHPLGDIVLLMNLLSTSIRPDSFGPIRSSDQDQLDVQKWIVDRLTHMLSEPAIPDEGVEPYTAHDICAMRLEVLLLLESLAFQPTAATQKHASTILALHPNALARLFRSMHDELDALYSSPPESELRVSLVNGLMRLIFGVMRQHASLINMQEKLACVSGSKQKHLVVLTRLAFCDGTVLEAGIDDETVDMAHELLEEWTNPQEAESLAEAFPSSRRE